MTEHQKKFEELYKGKPIAVKNFVKNMYSYGYFMRWLSDTTFEFYSLPAGRYFSVSEETIDITSPDYGFELKPHEEDFGTKWNKRMKELGAKQGTIKDLLSI